MICYGIEYWLVLHELSPEDDGEPIGWLDIAWNQWKEAHSEQLALLKQRGNDLGCVLPFFDIEKRLGSEKRQPRSVTAKEVVEELLKRMKTVRQPHTYLLMQIMEKEETASEASWRAVWDAFLQEEMNRGRSFMYQACLDLRLLLGGQDEQQVKEVADDLVEALSKQDPQQVQTLITLTNIYLQRHLDLTEMSGLIGMPDLRRMRAAWTKWDELDFYGLPGMRGLRELLILRYMRVILDRASFTELISLLDRDYIIGRLCNILGQVANIYASEVLLCLYSLLTLSNPIALDTKRQVEKCTGLFEDRVQSITAEDRMLLISIRQSIGSPATAKALLTVPASAETPDNRATILLALNDLRQLTKAQVELLLTSCADMREVTEDRNLESGPSVRSVAWRLIERQYELDDAAFLSAINALDDGDPLICAAAALLLRRVKTPPGHLLKRAANKIMALLSDELLSSRPLDPPDYKYWRLDDVLFEVLKAIVVYGP